MIEKDLSTKLLKIWSINLFLLQESIFKMVNNYTVEADKNELLNKLLTGEFCTPSPIVCAENHLLLELN